MGRIRPGSRFRNSLMGISCYICSGRIPYSPFTDASFKTLFQKSTLMADSNVNSLGCMYCTVLYANYLWKNSNSETHALFFNTFLGGILLGVITGIGLLLIAKTRNQGD